MIMWEIRMEESKRLSEQTFRHLEYVHNERKRETESNMRWEEKKRREDELRMRRSLFPLPSFGLDVGLDVFLR